MNIKQIVSVAFMIFSCTTFAQSNGDETSEWSDASDMNGRVRTVKEMNYSINSSQRGRFSDQNVKLADELVRNFDHSGRLIDQTSTTYASGNVRKWIFTYNQDGQLGEEVTQDNSEIANTVVYAYQQGKLVKKTWYKGAKKEIEKIWYYQYSNTGRLVNEYWTDSQNKVAWKCNYVYDIRGNLIEKNWSVDDRPTSKWTYRYDADGNIIENAEYTNGFLQEVTFNAYDKQNRLKEARTFRNNTLDIRKVYKYSGKGLHMEWWYDNNGKQIQRRNYDYDKAKRRTAAFTWTTSSNLLDKTYWTYDSNGNWKQRIEFDVHTPIYTTKRIIEYY
jgi:antitoxin component YwqK of YwqJK toxin-antitoxin module